LLDFQLVPKRRTQHCIRSNFFRTNKWCKL